MKEQQTARHRNLGLESATALNLILVGIASLFQPWQPRGRLRKLRLSGLSPTPEELAVLRKLSGAVGLELPTSACLQRDIVVPRSAKSKAAQAIQLHLRGTLPAEARGLVWRHALSEQTSHSVKYTCHILKETQLLSLRQAVSEAGVRLIEIRLAKVDAAPFWEVVPHQPSTAKTWAAATLLGCALAALVVIIQTEAQVTEMHNQLATRTDIIAQLEDRFRRLEEVNNTSQADSAQLTSQIEDFQNGLRPLTGIGQIAAVLPEGVWISELSVSGAAWRLSGFAPGEVTNTVQALQTLPGAENVRLSGPVILDTYSQQNRFDIEFTLFQQVAQ